ncbi:MAG: tRNA (adenosine(37)-N6)-threonylcarbamoyltransferase complex ATPase subunit type 1 TsaE [Alphaproteobacteria bacterium]|nr:tRNA (adenosine(37)-N6)-threonylcarbamoyltransferase complex ATPase subunit type 1 TsaE [Alphaproteobacteria bacterium]
MSTLDIELPDLDATTRLGAALARGLRRGDVIALRGDLGAGKTELARALIRAASADPDLIVPSPTFGLVEVYDTNAGAIWHFDLYRLDSPEQVWELGFEEALADGICVIEWPERLDGVLPARRLDVALHVTRGDARRATLTGESSWHDRLAALAQEWPGG